MRKDNPQNPHKGHRSRLKKRFLQDGLYGFEKHNILELLLFFAVPYKDTNELAHTLLSRFGSISAVFEADFDELVKVDGVGENTATLLKLIPALAREYLMDKTTRYKSFGNINRIGEYLVNYYIGCKTENAVVLLLNNNMEMISCVPLGSGTVNASNVNVRLIAENGLKHNASCFILAHNHPDGSPDPSNDDIAATRSIRSIFDSLGMPMIEHIIVAGSTFKPIMRQIERKIGDDSFI